jgi:predicted DNA-binding transcriptional regulator AlpA
MKPLLMRERDACAYVGLSRMSLRRHGPKPIRIGRCVRWPVSALDGWLAARLQKTHREDADAATQRAVDAIRQARRPHAR